MKPQPHDRNEGNDIVSMDIEDNHTLFYADNKETAWITVTSDIVESTEKMR